MTRKICRFYAACPKGADGIIKVSKNTYNVGLDEPKKEVQEPQKGKTIAERKAMFEPKQPEGPKF